MQIKDISKDKQQDIINFYLEPHSLNDTVLKFNLSNRYILKQILKLNNIKQHDKNIQKKIQRKNIEQTCLEKYGVKCNWASKDPKLNGQATMIEKYGFAHPLQNKELFDKMIKTKEERYNNKNYNNHSKCEETNLQKYGRQNVGQFGSEENKKAMLEKYGVESIFQNRNLDERLQYIDLDKYGAFWLDRLLEIKEKQRKTKLELYNTTGVPNTETSIEQAKETRKKTMLEKYGVEYWSQNLDFKERLKNINLEKYGIENIFQVDQVKAKIRETLFQKYGCYHAPTNYIKYDSISFDSFPELCFYLYCKNNNINIERTSKWFEYEFNNKQYKYYPDFLVNNEFIEIKGDHFFKEEKMINPYDHSQDDLYEAKHQCMIKNNVRILTSKEYQKYIDWFYNMGFKKEDFLKKNIV